MDGDVANLDERPRSGSPVAASVGWIVLLAFAASMPFFFYGAPIGHSTAYDVPWHAAFSEQLFAGDLYPRWLPQLNEGAGGPIFYFYAPLPFYVSAIFGKLLCWGCPPATELMIGILVLLAASGLAFFVWARRRASLPAALVASAVYMFLPYHFEIDVWYRMAIGEFAAYVWMPLILLGLERHREGPGFSVLAAAAYAALILSHIPSALLFSPVMAAYAVWLFGVRRGVRCLLLPVGLGVGLSAVYLVPALTTQEHINAAAWWRDYFDPLRWLFFDGRPGPGRFEDIVLTRLAAVTTIAAAIGLWRLLGAEDRRASPAAFYLIVLAWCWFMMSAPSAPLWEHIAVLRKVQFPWRLGIVIDFCAAGSVLLLFEKEMTGPRLRAGLLSVLALVLAGNYLWNAPTMLMQLPEMRTADQRQEAADAARSAFNPPEYETVWLNLDPPEYKTEWLNLDLPGYETVWLNFGRSGRAGPLRRVPRGWWIELLRDVPLVSLPGEQGQVEMVERGPHRLVIDVRAENPARVLVRHFYYPTWRAHIAGSGAPLALAPSPTLGLIEVEVPPGRHRVVLSRVALAEEYAGLAVSAGAALLCAVLLIVAARRRAREPAQRG